jgi:hypothetical protein
VNGAAAEREELKEALAQRQERKGEQQVRHPHIYAQLPTGTFI